MDIEKATEVREGIPQAVDENSVDQDQRVEENTEKNTQNADEDTQEVAELLASNMSIEEDVQDEHMEFSTGIDLNIEDINTDFYSEVFQDGQGTSQYVQETTEAQNVEVSATQKVEVSTAEPGVQNVQLTEPVQIDEAVEVVEIAPTTEEVQIADQNAQDAEQNQLFSDQNVDQNASNELVMSADPVPLASGSLPSEEV